MKTVTLRSPRSALLFFAMVAACFAILVAFLAGGPFSSLAVAQSASASASAAPPPPSLSGKDIPTERSDPPTPAEWKTARPISPTESYRDCKFKVLREYLRVSCDNYVGAGLVAGEPKDVRVWVSGTPGWDSIAEKSRVPVTTADVPLRRGESTIVSLHSMDWQYNGATLADGGMLIVSWREGEESPLILMTGSY